EVSERSGDDGDAALEGVRRHSRSGTGKAGTSALAPLRCWQSQHLRSCPAPSSLRRCAPPSSLRRIVAGVRRAGVFEGPYGQGLVEVLEGQSLVLPQGVAERP